MNTLHKLLVAMLALHAMPAILHAQETVPTASSPAADSLRFTLQSNCPEWSLTPSADHSLNIAVTSANNAVRITGIPPAADRFTQCRVRMTVTLKHPDNPPADCRAFLLWGTDASPLQDAFGAVHPDQLIQLPVATDGKPHDYPFQLNDTPHWRSVIRDLWLIPIAGTEAAVNIHAVTFTDTPSPSPADLWDLARLKQPPRVLAWGAEQFKTVKDDNGMERAIITRKVWYENEPYKGAPTRVMAFFSRPQGNGPFPGMVLVHGGGGTAFSDWTELWAARGYAAISMDHYGCEVDGDESSNTNRARHRLPDGSPDGPSTGAVTRESFKNTWGYHAIASIMRAHSLLDAQPQVAPDRTGITGMSWGGYLTSLAAGVDDRFQVAIPFYGCGDLINSLFAPPLVYAGAEKANLWRQLLDPVSFIRNARCKILFSNNTDDFAYQLTAHKATWQQAQDADVWLEVGMPHSMPNAWRPEILRYVNFALNHGTPLPCLTPLRCTQDAQGLHFSADLKYDGATAVSARLLYTTDAGGFDPVKKGVDKWIKRKWSSIPAVISNRTVTATLPPEIVARPLRAFLSAKDADGLSASTHILIIGIR